MSTTAKRYFLECQSLDEAKNLFRKLCFSLHPDTSGYDSEKDFISMFKQFEEFKPCEQFKRQTDDLFNAKQFYNTVKRFDGLEGVLITFVGSFIWLEDAPDCLGSTRHQKEEIKSILLDGYNSPRFSRRHVKWYYSPEGYKQKHRTKKNFEQIRQTWGSKSYNPRQEEKKTKQLSA